MKILYESLDDDPRQWIYRIGHKRIRVSVGFYEEDRPTDGKFSLMGQLWTDLAGWHVVIEDLVPSSHLRRLSKLKGQAKLIEFAREYVLSLMVMFIDDD